METVTLAGGCFWCTEAIFKRLKGVEKVVSGYTGGNMEKPSYEQVSSGSTGHAEAIQITFDPKIITYKKLLDVYWHLIDPTTLNKQGADTGEQYRSVIFYHDDEQKRIAEESKKKLEQSKYYQDPIVTKIEPFQNFYPAEDYHQNYYENHADQPYCKIVIDPKIQKLMLKYPRLA
ncbi:MAG: peptide-methionine (S)-S-oxide reductase MsrA [Candidatus Daviesbacteria bacterium]|nr:peptide-methionine (S)-S-oxide reductase MsrA [Candidatus Daviesbacteria bacterium]